MNYLTFSIILFVVAFSILHALRPSLIYLPDGSLRPFGIGYKKRTVVPMWFAVLLIAIFSYTLALYFSPK